MSPASTPGGYAGRNYFNAFKQLNGLIDSITVWGQADNHTWLTTGSRAEVPMLFDLSLKDKPAYWGVVDPSKLPGANLTGSIATKAGTPDARVWTLSFSNADHGTAYGVRLPGAGRLRRRGPFQRRQRLARRPRQGLARADQQPHQPIPLTRAPHRTMNKKRQLLCAAAATLLTLTPAGASAYPGASAGWGFSLLKDDADNYLLVTGTEFAPGSPSAFGSYADLLAPAPKHGSWSLVGLAGLLALTERRRGLRSRRSA